MLKNIQIVLRQAKFSTKAKPIVNLDKHISKSLENELYKPRHHPGAFPTKSIALPEHILQAITTSIKDTPPKTLWNDSQTLNRYLRGRHIPVEHNQFNQKKRQIVKQVEAELNVDLSMLEQDELDQMKSKIKEKVEKRLQQQIYSWQQIDYDSYKSLQYLFGRSPQEYSTIMRIFQEIDRRIPNYKPRSFFDFGAGVGTGIWAASSLWKKTIFEYYLVDSSHHMNELSDLILRDGMDNKEMNLKNVYHRQFLPASSDVKYDIVLCAYSLFELPNAKTRLETILNLWNKCDGFLVIIEQGSRAGFNIVNEARDFILHATKENSNAHVFAPCAHDLNCPRYIANDGTPCNFISSYTPLVYSNSTVVKHELYSYVVIKKGQHNLTETTQQWPRIVRPTLVRARHSICRLCTAAGKLDEVIFTASKHGKYAYRCARSSNWGDLLPITIEENQQSEKAKNDSNK